MKRRFIEAYPMAKWYEYEPISDDNVRAGSKLAFGGAYRPLVDLKRAAIILSLDGDFLGSERTALRVAPDFADGRRPETGEMSRVYVIESGFSMTGGVADHRLAVRSELVTAIAVALDARLSSQAAAPSVLGAPQPAPKAAILDDPKVQKFLAVVEKDLLANRGKSVVVTGEHQPPEVHALVHRLNAVLGNVGSTVSYVPDPLGDRPLHFDQITELAGELKGDRVDTLIVLGGNPAYDAPSDLSFATLISKGARPGRAAARS
jgi:molybdopterin-containing oxidoreductase family iron-sulfur binding subunit